MAHRNSTLSPFGSPLLLGILISLIVHVVAATFGSPFQFESKKLTPTMTVVLQPPKPEPPPPPPPEPEPPKPEPPKPQPQKVTPPPPVRTPLPPPREERVNAPSPAVTPPPPPQVIASAPVDDSKPTFTAPSAEAEKSHASQPTVDIDADLGNYGSLLAREFAKHKQYPRIAQMRGWQGEVRVKLEVDANGTVTSSTISQSSGHEALDNQALEMVKKASPLPMPPESLRHRPFTITVPILFRLE